MYRMIKIAVLFVIINAGHVFAGKSASCDQCTKPNPETSSTSTKTFDKDFNPISSITFTPGRTDVTGTVRLREPLEGLEPLLMRSDNPNDPDSYVLVAPLEYVCERGGSMYKCELPDLDTKNKNRVYSIQVEMGGNHYSTEPFMFSEKEQSYVLIREMSNKSMKAGICLGLIVAILINLA